jgi:nucleoside-diphosphate-sugar epimerase
LITGCSGQIGTAIVPKLIKIYGEENVILTDESKRGNPYPRGIFERLDVTDISHYKYLMEKHQINYIVHLTGVQSAFGEKNPYLAMKINFEGVINAFDMAKEYDAKYI